MILPETISKNAQNAQSYPQPEHTAHWALHQGNTRYSIDLHRKN
jgi:hypothetical protein